MTSPAISFEGLEKVYGNGINALHPLNLDVRHGEILGFLGPNGAGKTTTMRILSGVLLPSHGRVLVEGFDVVKQPVEAKARMGYIPDRPYLYEALSIQEFLEFVGAMYGVPRAAVFQGIDQWLETFELLPFRHELIRHLSHGMRQKVVITAAMLHEPQVLVVDEPMVGLDAAGVRRLKDLFRARVRAGASVFVSTHSMALAEEICDRIAILHHGKLLALGTLDELRQLGKQQAQTENLETLFLRLTGAKSAPETEA